jgi:Flp pilus assembly protein TadD
VHLLACSLSDAGDRAAAVEFLRLAQEERPGDAWTSAGLAIELLRADPPDPMESLRFSMAALALRPGDACLEHLVAAGFLGAGLPERAHDYAQHAAGLTPDHAAHSKGLGLVLVRLSRMEEAEKCFRRATEQEPESALFLTELGKFLAETGRAADAEAALRRAAEIDDTSPPAATELGKFLAKQGEADEAFTWFARAAALGPEDFEARRCHGEALAARGKVEEAEVEYAKCAALRPKDARVRCASGALLLALNRPKEAYRKYRAALDIDKKLPDALRALTRLCLGSNDPDLRDPAGAVETAKVLAGIAPEDPEALRLLGYALFVTGNPAAAREPLARSLEKEKDETVAVKCRLYLAMTLYSLVRVPEAKGHLAEATGWIAANAPGDEGLSMLRAAAAAHLHVK